ncbi:9282_t:CDS:2 [Paraglomus brasilianum]|uniref:Type 1 phosphatases regulator n=1 Tax=Paraglomus brasilianum TaxID=144538 RepID=A0A9N8VMT8_9GLOM|nr:9282_t:CDS:2 [Paraglomus brasilianum]
MAAAGLSRTCNGTRTITLVQTDLEDTGQDSVNAESSAGTLILRGGNLAQERKVKWDENVIDNEGANKKKSKICCIYHRPRVFGESSDDSDSSGTDSESDHDHCHDDMKQHHCHNGQSKGKHASRLEKRPNAYERQPRYKDRSKPPDPSKQHPTDRNKND